MEAICVFCELYIYHVHNFSLPWQNSVYLKLLFVFHITHCCGFNFTLKKRLDVIEN
jgi:hypothetical protein